MTFKRIYLVHNKQTGDRHLVEAVHPASAIKMVADGHYEASLPNSVELARLMEDGLRVQRTQAAESV